MPRISRIRVTNIQFDNGKKHMPDIVFDAKGLDSLLVLANGGGKSLLIQLILQTVLPNTKMGERRVADLFNHAHYTGHVAVEWLLDNIGNRRQYLCTGFCFSNGQSSEVPIRYFNYLFEYENNAALDIASLPLVETDENGGMKRPAQYQKLKDWLRENGIQIIDSPGLYRERLKIYQILAEEWKNIRDTNGSEGGVDKFFEKSRTTMQLLDNLLIPTVEQIIFQNEARKKELFHAFAQHREMLLEIPLIKQNLKDFAIIRDHAQGVVDVVAELDNLQRDYDAKTKEMIKLARTFYALAEEAKQEITDLDQQKDEALTRQIELSWKSRSHEVFLKQLDYRAALAAGQMAEKDYIGEKQVLDDARARENILKAIYYFNDADKAEKEELEYRTALELMDREQPELLSLLTEKKGILRAAWDQKKLMLEEQGAQRKAELTQLAGEKGSISREQAEARNLDRKTSRELADVEAWLDRYAKARGSLLEHLDPEEVINPAQGLANRQAALASYEKQEIDTNECIQGIKFRMEALNEETLALRGDKHRAETEAEQYGVKIAGFSEAEQNIRGLLGEHNLFVKSMLPEKEEVLLRLRDRLGRVQQRRLGIQAELANLQEKWALLEGRDYYVPHHDLLKIKNRLEKAGIYAVLGSEWLAEQQLSKQEKEAVIRAQPGLPYAVLIESNQVNAVKNIMKQVREWTRDIPLLFLVKSADILKTADSMETFMPFWHDELFIYLPDSCGVYASPEAFQELKDRFEEGVTLKNDQLKEAVEQENILLGLQNEASIFYRTFSQKEIDEWAEAKARLMADAQELGKQITTEEQQKLQYKSEVSHLEKQLQDIANEIRQLNRIIEKLQGYHELHREYPRQEKAKAELTNQLTQLNNKIDGLQAKLVEIAEKEADKKNSIRDTERLINGHQQGFVNYNLDGVEPVTELKLSYDEAEIEVKSVIQQLSQKQGERENIQKLLGKAGERKREALYEVESTEVGEAWLKENCRPVTRDEIQNAGRVIKERQSSFDRAKEIFDEAKQGLAKTEALLKDAEARIAADFSGRSPYDGFSEADHLLHMESLTKSSEDVGRLLQELTRRIEKTGNRQTEAFDAYETLEEKMPIEMKQFWAEVAPYMPGEWEEFKAKPRKIITQSEDERNKIQNGIVRQQNKVNIAFERYLHDLRTTNNVKVRQFIRDVKAIMDDNRLYDYDFVQNQFIRIFEGLEQYEKQYQITLAECEVNKTHLINLCLRRAKAVYDSVMEIPKNSRINVYSRDVQVIRIDWPVLDETEINQKMNSYFEQVLEDMQLWKEEGKDDDEINRRIEEKLKTRHLIQVIAPFEHCRITVFKPRQESIIRHGRIDYFPWDEVSRWSGGEEYAVYITMFMIMLTHIRQQSEGRRNLWKVLVADNPFGKASSPHILETVFQIASANKIQLLCLTAHKQEDILKRFPVVYSLHLRSAYGKEIIWTDLMESGFYRIDTASGDGSQMMLPV